MTKTLFATLLAGTIALTSLTPTAARANDHLGKLLVGVVALGIIAAAIDDANDKKRQKSQRRVKKNKDHGRINRRAERFVIPSRCVRDFRTADGVRRAVGERCVTRNAPRVSLPSQCRRTLWTDVGIRDVFGRRCLQRNGYVFS